MKRYLPFAIAGLVLSVIFGLSTVYYISHKTNSETTGVTEEITLKDVQQHNQPENCWIIIGTRVYSLTRYIAAHPEDSMYKSLCGSNATDALVGVNPSKDSQKIFDKLGPYYIGIIVP